MNSLEKDMSSVLRISGISLVSILVLTLLAASPGSACADPPQVVVASTGEMPRAVLRYRLKPGQIQKTVLRMKQRVGESMGADSVELEDVPDTELVFTSTVLSENDDSSWNIMFEVTNARTVGFNVDPLMKELMDEELSKEIGVKFRGRFFSNGMMDDLKVVKAARGMTQAEEQEFLETFAEAMQVLPHEPVGRGATWLQETRIVAPAGFIIQQTTVTRLRDVSRTGIIELRVSIDQEIIDRSFSIPNQPSLQATVKRFSGSGSGTSTVSLSAPNPLKGSVSLNLESSIQLSDGRDSAMLNSGQKVVMEMESNDLAGGDT